MFFIIYETFSHQKVSLNLFKIIYNFVRIENHLFKWPVWSSKVSYWSSFLACSDFNGMIEFGIFLMLTFKINGIETQVHFEFLQQSRLRVNQSWFLFLFLPYLNVDEIFQLVRLQFKKFTNFMVDSTIRSLHQKTAYSWEKDCV